MSEAQPDLRTKMLAALADVEKMELDAKGKVVEDIIGSLPQDTGAKIMARALPRLSETGIITVQDLLIILKDFFKGIEITKEDTNT